MWAANRGVEAMVRRSLTGPAGLCLAVLAVGACDEPPSTPSPPPPSVPADPDGNFFAYTEVGDLIEGSGTGRTDEVVYLEGIRFPLESAPAFANSQVWGAGGLNGPGGGQCAGDNYVYPWRDNFCETRSWSVSFCPAAHGHQGQDLRPATCEASVHWAVAAEEGEIFSIGAYHVSLLGESGTIYRYLHLDMDKLAVSIDTPVFRGQRIGLVSDDFGDMATTIHLHFDAQIAMTLDGVTDYHFVPPYTSLVAAYEGLLKGEP